MTPKASDGQSPIPQSVATPLTRAAIFLVVTINPGARHRVLIRTFCADLAALVRSVGFREQEGTLSCVAGFGSDAWDRVFGKPRPRELHKFREIRAGERHAVSTPGDMLLHIRRSAWTCASSWRRRSRFGLDLRSARLTRFMVSV